MANKMLKFRAKVVKMLRSHYHLTDKKGTDYKCILGQMACQAKIPIPLEHNDTAVAYENDYSSLEVKEAMTPFIEALTREYGLSLGQLKKLQQANDFEQEKLKQLLIEYGLIPADSKIEFKQVERFNLKI